MIFSPKKVRIAYEDSTSEEIIISTDNICYGNKAKVYLNIDESGIVSPIIEAIDDIKPSYLNIEFEIPSEMLDDELYYYYAAYTTNDIASIFRHKEKSKNDMKDFFIAKNKATGAYINIGILTAHKIFSIVRLVENTVSVHYDLECKLISASQSLDLEKFIYGNDNELDFLEKRYAPLVAKLNNARPLASTPVGWCSWSCYYRDVDDEKINNCIDDMIKIKGTDLFQIDDGWQIDSTHAGDWIIDDEKFPNGLNGSIKKCNDNGMTFGLWLSPFLADEDSVHYEKIKHLVKTDIKAGNSTPTKTFHPFDLDNPEYYKKLYETYHYLSYELGVKYYKLDFLVFGYFSFNSQVKFKSDYRSALFRKVISTIREAVGDDAIMLSCGSPIVECAGIFDAQRISRDIICRKGRHDPFYWQHWSNIKNASKTVLYRYFYNNIVFRNDPDGVVLRDYDIGDGFDCNYAEARYWSTIVAFSGGLVLTNDEFRHLSKQRKQLLTKLIPPLGISGRALDMFEYPAPTKAIIDAAHDTKYIAKFNMSDSFEDIDVDLKEYGFKDDKLIFKCWEAEFVGKASTIHEELVNPHNALMYMIKDIPSEPTFIYSDINIYLGYNIFESEFVNGTLEIKANEQNKKFVNDTTKVYAYYPKSYSSAIGKKHEEIIIEENEEFIITEYKL